MDDALRDTGQGWVNHAFLTLLLLLSPPVAVPPGMICSPGVQGRGRFRI
ncbi:Hypothetical protein SMB2099_4344 [Serratia marcescens SMB2099]|nr:Hypothetical protein SMB2099_4344 [Serratia marcescens SMB2099]